MAFDRGRHLVYLLAGISLQATIKMQTSTKSQFLSIYQYLLEVPEPRDKNA